MLKYGFRLFALNTSTPVLAGAFRIPAVRKLTLVYMWVDAHLTVGGLGYDVPVRLRVTAGAGGASGEVFDFTGAIGTSIDENRGAIYCSDKQAFRGCWELPQGVDTFNIEAVLSDGGAPPGPWSSISVRCNLMFET
jgi:hypothetical protein